MTAGRAKLCDETHPRTFVSDTMDGTARASSLDVVHLIRALCRLHRHLVRIPELSFLPEPERDRRDLARQRNFGQFLAYAATDARVIEVFQWTRLGRRCIRRPFEHILERRVVIAIEPTRERCSPAAA